MPHAELTLWSSLVNRGVESGRFLCAIPPDPEWIRVNEEIAEKDHAKLREAITAWIRKTGMRVLLIPAMSYAIPLLKPCSSTNCRTT